MYLVATNIKDLARKRALLLYQAGPEVHEIFKTLPDTGEANEYDKAVQALTKHFEPQKNLIYQTYVFRQATQRADETIDEFHTRLRSLAEHCGFKDADQTDFEIKMQIVCNGSSSKLRRRALKDPEYKLPDMLIDGRKEETSFAQATGIEQKIHQDEQQASINKTNQKCFYCGFDYPHVTRPCPAKEANCNFCSKKGHFAKVCKKRNQQNNDQRKEDKKKNSRGQTQKHKESNKSQRARAVKNSTQDDSSSESGESYAYTVTEKESPKVHTSVLVNGE